MISTPIRHPARAFVLWAAIVCLPGPQLVAQQGYRSHHPPTEFTFAEPTPARYPADPSRELGTFRAGLSVEVLEARSAEGWWLVEYHRIRESNILALIPIPSLADPGSPAFEEAVSVLGGFPLLHRLLETGDPWAKRWRESPQGILSSKISARKGSGDRASRFVCEALQTNTAWSLEPLHLYYDVSNPARPKFVAEFWSKGEAFRRPDFRDEPARNELRRNLQQIAGFFDASGKSIQRERGSNPHVRGIRDNVEIFLLPNDTRVSLYYHRGEYLYLEIEQASVAASHQTVQRSATELAGYLREKVKEKEDGTVYVGGIPMIDQGLTSYCVPATMARVLNFYGYDVNTHSLAMLAGTMKQEARPASGGTTGKDMMRAMRRITNGSPFRLREVKDAGAGAIQEVVQSGVPIIWLIDGHLRLLIGINPKAKQVIFSDSWGPGHDFKAMPYHQFARINRGMWVMEPR